MTKKKILAIAVGVLLVNLIFCTWLIISNLNSDNKLEIPHQEVKSGIPFIPSEASGKDAVVENQEEPKVASILEGKSDKEIDEHLSQSKSEIHAIKMPSIVDTVKNEDALKCQEFVRNTNSTDKDKYMIKRDC